VGAAAWTAVRAAAGQSRDGADLKLKDVGIDQHLDAHPPDLEFVDETDVTSRSVSTTAAARRFVTTSARCSARSR
jgi:hypothetical protein